MVSQCKVDAAIVLGVIVSRVPFLSLSAPVKAQSSASTTQNSGADAEPLLFDSGAAALWQSLQKLHTRASLLMVTAHPDDEDGGMLTYESRGQGGRVALLTLNRGEGGANVMSSDH